MDEKISVIIPTIQKDTVVLQMLIDILEEDEAVSEIIIINNAIVPFSPELVGNKLKIHVPTRNLYVNESWNYGVSIAENNIFSLMNDDIICCKNLCSKVLETGFLNRNDVGLIGIDIHSINMYNRDEYNIDEFSSNVPNDKIPIQFIQINNYLNTGDWGSTIFGKKENYHVIPGLFKIIYGDNYLLIQNLISGKKNYCISGPRFNHIHSLSSMDSQFNDVISVDIQNAKHYFDAMSKLLNN